MSKIFNLALSCVKRLATVDSTIVKTDTQIVYRMPRVFKDPHDVLEVYLEEDFITVVSSRKMEDVGKIVPVAKSPLDAYRGRGLAMKNLI